MKNRPNTTQRSWSNYAGRPQPAAGTGVNEGFMTPEQRRKRREQEGALQRGMRNMGGMKPMAVEPMGFGQQIV